MSTEIAIKYIRADDKKFLIKCTEDNFKHNILFDGEISVTLADDATKMVKEASKEFNYANLDMIEFITHIAEKYIDTDTVDAFKHISPICVTVTFKDLINIDKYIELGYEIENTNLIVIWKNHNMTIEEIE